jgi:hypothetical protein
MSLTVVPRTAVEGRRRCERVSVDHRRAVIGGLVSQVRPVDAQEAADQAAIAEWVESGRPLFRTVAPATPPKHLVSYFVPLDAVGRSVLLGDRVKSGLWLPPGGHRREGSTPTSMCRCGSCSIAAAPSNSAPTRVSSGPSGGTTLTSNWNGRPLRSTPR